MLVRQVWDDVQVLGRKVTPRTWCLCVCRGVLDSVWVIQQPVKAFSLKSRGDSHSTWGKSTSEVGKRLEGPWVTLLATHNCTQASPSSGFCVQRVEERLNLQSHIPLAMVPS